MYISKYYTCEEIDQRLLQGYYDDAVKAGFEGSLKEFWAFVLSISDKADQTDVDDALITLKKKLNKKIKAVQQALDDYKLEVKDAIPTKVSQLENDAEYQTKQQVEEYISKLVDGADDALDTLLELAEALGNDPNFAATMTEKLSQLKASIDSEVTRAKEVEAELKQALADEIYKREQNDFSILQVIEEHVSRLTGQIEQAYLLFDNKFTELARQYAELLKTCTDFAVQVEQKFTDYRKEAQDANDTLETKLRGEIATEASRAKQAEQALLEKHDEFEHQYVIDQAVQDKKIADLQLDLINETSQRSQADLELKQSITEEATKRSQQVADLTQRLFDEAQKRFEADTNLNAAIQKEATIRQAADEALRHDLELEAQERKLEDTKINSRYDSLVAQHNNDIKDLQNQINNNKDVLDSGLDDKVDKRDGYGLSKNDFTDELLAKLNAIEANANYITKVSQLINDLNFQTADQVADAIQRVVGAAPEALDTLRELAEAINNDPNFAGSIIQKLTDLASQLNEEVAARIKGDKDLEAAFQKEMDTYRTELNAKQSVLEERLNTYKTLCDNNYQLAQNAISALNTKVDDLKSTYLTELQKLTDTYNAKVQELIAQYAQFTSDINARVTAQDAAIQQNNANIQRNLELIQGIQKDIQSIKTGLENNWAQIFEAIKAEASARQTADEALETYIRQVEAKIEGAVFWTSIPAPGSPQRKAIVLDNYDTILGRNLLGRAVNLIMLSKWGVVDVGSPQDPINLNGSEERPTYNDTKQIALMEDLESVQKSLQEAMDKALEEFTFEDSWTIAFTKGEKKNTAEVRISPEDRFLTKTTEGLKVAVGFRITDEGPESDHYTFELLDKEGKAITATSQEVPKIPNNLHSMTQTEAEEMFNSIYS